MAGSVLTLHTPSSNVSDLYFLDLASKSKVHQKLKDPSHPEDDDYVYTEDDYYVNSYGDDEYWAYDPWATPAPSSVENMMDGVESVTARTGIANREDATATPTQAPPAVGDSIVVTTRSGSNPASVTLPSDIQTVQAMEEVAEESLGPATIGAPKVQRELFPDPVQLKAHSSVHLQEHDPEFFAETSSFLTPCLQQAYEGSLQAYKLTVDYSDGPDASAHGVIITHMEIHTVISVVTDTIEELKSITHDSATKVLHNCFDGGKLYQYLGSLRREGVEINEIEFQDRPFKSPIFGNGEPVGIISNGGRSSPISEPKKSRAGLITTLTIGMVVVGVVLLAHRRGKLPAVHIPTDRIGHLAKSIRNPFKGEKVGRMSRAFRDRFYSSFNSSDQAVVAGLSDSSQSSNNDSSGAEYKPRERSWSGSLRRYPEGGVRPAALQKQPARSSDYLRSPMPSPRTDVSHSVAGDYNVPEEYDFQATPVSSAYSSALLPKRALSTTSSKSVEEFSMPEDYNTVHEDMSLYSRNTNMLGGRAGGAYPPVRTPTSRASRAEDVYSRQSTSPQRMMGLNNNSLLSPAESKSAASSYYEGSSQTKEPYIDEWSVASFQTSSPPGAAPAAGATEALSPPYRHWNEKPKDSPGSRLAMPRLS